MRVMRQTKHKPTKKHAQRPSNNRQIQPKKAPFIAHVHELRRRLFYVALSVGIFGGIAFALQRTLTRLLLAPAGNQQFIYTTPGGGFDFQFRLCLYAGIAASIPVIVFQILRYINPLLKHETRRFLLWATLASSILAAGGIVFGYVLGLPAAMHFLLQGISTTKQIEALISIQSYLSFILTYLLGTALLFQIPLILLLINRIKPLPPKKLFKQQRWLIVGSLVIGAIISPTPDIRNQLIFALPIVAMYDGSVALIWFINRGRNRPKRIVALLAQDRELQATRLANFYEAVRIQNPKPQSVSTVSPKPIQNVSAPTTAPSSIRPSGYIQGFNRRQFNNRQTI